MDTNGLTLHRTGQGPALLLLHCLGVDHRMWDIAAAGLAQDFTLLSMNFPGHGDAPPARDHYGIADLSKQVAALLQRDGIDRAHIAGISLGGLVAQHLAATQPSMVDHLVLIDTTPRYTDERRANWVERAAVARRDGVRTMIDGLLSIWFTQDAIAADGPAIHYVRDCFMRCDGEAYALACEALGDADLRDIAKNITAPTLVICGEQDVPSFLDAAHWLQANISGAHLAWLAPAKHASVLEQPVQFATALKRFLLHA